MHRKLFVLIGSLLLVLLTTSGCLDLFAVPGIVVSPDGSTAYFIGGGLDMESGEDLQTSLTALNLSDGSTEVLVEGDENTLISAFAVNPVDGTLAFVRSVQGGAFTLDVYNGGSTAVVVELPTNTIGTMAAFSPDGNWLALTLVTLPEGMAEGEEFSAEAAATATFGVYLVNGADGSVTLISDDANTRANTLAWSPDGSYLAYNAWVDSNGDGRIQTSGGFDMSAMMGGASTDAPQPDLSHIFVYDVAAGSTTQIETETVDYGQVFLDDSTLAYVSINFAGMMTGEMPGINIYDIGSGESESVYSAQALISGIALSPDGSMVAWTESSSQMPSGSGTEEEAPSSILNIGGTDFEPTQTVVLEGIALPDAPVWVGNDGVLAASTNLLASFAGSFAASFSFSTDGSSSASAEATPEVPLQQIIWVGTDGTTEVVYEGALINPSFATSLLALADMGMTEEGGGS